MNLSPDDEETLKPIPMAVVPTVPVDAAGKTSTGRRRPDNQDAWGQSPDDRIFAVADGVGGTRGGAKASEYAISELLGADPSEGWVQMLGAISRTVRRRCDEQGLPEAASTLVALVVETERCVLLSIGDSRIYRVRDGELRLLTCDHNMGNLWSETGERPPGATRRDAGALTSYVGSTDPDQRVDVSMVAAFPGDRFLLCSDGIHGQLSADAILMALGEPSCAEAADRLVRAADDAGGKDNATALVVDFEAKDLLPAGMVD